ncbi:MAG: hypothetical protein GY754_24980 [bacterium]|nr:hypothetical protein [bacterium]
MKNKFFISIVSLTLFGLLLAGSGQRVFGAEKKRIAVMDFAANNIPQSYARIARTKIELILYRSHKFDVLDRKMIQPIVEEKKLGTLNCGEKACAIQIGKYVSADYVVMGSIDAVDKYTITIRIVDVVLGKIVFADTITTDSQDKVVEKSSEAGDLIEDTINMLVPGLSPPEPGSYRFNCYIMGGYIQPITNLADITSGGFSVVLSGGIENLFLDNLFFTLETGYSRLPGKGDREYASIIPMLINCGYTYRFSTSISLAPVLSFGVGYNSIKELGTLRSGIEPIVKGGFYFDYMIPYDYSFRFATEYCNIFEQEGVMSYFSFTLGAGILF